jgi:ribonuclease HI
MKLYGFQIYKRKSIRGPIAYVFTDASSDFDSKKSCAGIVIDSSDIFKKLSADIDYYDNIAVCEAQAVRLSIAIAHEHNIDAIIIHTDCESLVRSIVKPTGKEPEDLRAEIKRIKKESRNLSLVSIVLVSRFLTEEAHKLALGRLREIR